MIVTFRSKASGELIMMGQHAMPLLQAAGKTDETVQGARGVFTADQLASAIAGIERAIDSTQDPDFNEDDPEQAARALQYVGLRQRAHPLLDMLGKAQAKGVDVMWEVSGK